jgi:hypothetical protein
VNNCQVYNTKTNQEIRKIFDDNGLEYRHLDKDNFIIHDEGKRSIKNIINANNQINGQLTIIKGKG